MEVLLEQCLGRSADSRAICSITEHESSPSFVWCEVLCGITFCQFVVTCIAYAAYCMLSSVLRIVMQFALTKLLDRRRWAADEKHLRVYNVVLENSYPYHFITFQNSILLEQIRDVLD